MTLTGRNGRWLCRREGGSSQPPVALLRRVNATSVGSAASTAVADLIADRDNRNRTTCAMSIPPVLMTHLELMTVKNADPGLYPMKRSYSPSMPVVMTLSGCLPNTPPGSSTPMDPHPCGGQGGPLPERSCNTYTDEPDCGFGSGDERPRRNGLLDDRFDGPDDEYDCDHLRCGGISVATRSHNDDNDG